jgi:hypothetical protein
MKSFVRIVERIKITVNYVDQKIDVSDQRLGKSYLRDKLKPVDNIKNGYLQNML